MRRILFLLLFCAAALVQGRAQDTTTDTSQSLPNDLQGTYLRITVKGSYGILKASTQGLGFYPATTNTVVKANSAYLPTDVLASLDIRQMLQDAADGIQSPLAQPLPRGGGEIYDLTGRRVSQVRAGGIYIKDGRKYVVPSCARSEE